MSAETRGPGNPFGLLATRDTGKETSTSGPGQCGKSTDTRHHWISLGIGAQSIEVLKCSACGMKIYD